MGTKSLTITDEAYERLVANKEPNESFSDVINKITRKNSLFDLIGLLSKEEAERLSKNIAEDRKRIRNNMRRI